MELPPVVTPPVAVVLPPAPPAADPRDEHQLYKLDLQSFHKHLLLHQRLLPQIVTPPLPPVEEASPPLQSTGLLAANIALLSHVLECPPVPPVASPDVQRSEASSKTLPHVGLKGT